MYLFRSFIIYLLDKVVGWVGLILFFKFYYINFCKYLIMNVMKVVFDCN